MFTLWWKSPIAIKAVVLYWTAYGLYAILWASVIFLLAGFGSHGSYAMELVKGWIIPLILVIYGALALWLSRRFLSRTPWAKNGLLGLSFINIAWYASSYALYLRFLINKVDYVKIGSETIYLPQYPFFSYGQTNAPTLYNNLTFLALLFIACSVYVLLAKSHQRSVDLLPKHKSNV